MVYNALLFLYFNLHQIVKLDNLSCSFTSIAFLTNSSICLYLVISSILFTRFSCIRLNSLKSAGRDVVEKTFIKMGLKSKRFGQEEALVGLL